jgi:hypothetical protein
VAEFYFLRMTITTCLLGEHLTLRLIGVSSHNFQEHSLLAKQDIAIFPNFQKQFSYLKIFFNPFRVEAFRNDNHPSLDVEAQNNLSWGLIVLFPQ